MTALEDMLRGAFRAKADEVPSDVVPPLRLPARRRRSFSLAYGGGGRKGAPAWRGALAPAASAVLVAAVIAGAVALSHVLPGRQAPGWQQAATTTGNEAAAWVATQVSRSAVVSCDPVMCQALKAHGVPAGDLVVLHPGTANPLGSAVVVATAAVRSEFGSRLDSVYAPAVIASFGSGYLRIDVRAIAPHGAAAYRSALSADLRARRASGTLLARSNRIVVSATARRQLLAGQVDSRLLITIMGLATLHPVSIVAFGDSGPGVGAGGLLRSADLAETKDAPHSGRSAYMHQMLAFLHSQPGPYHAARTEIARLPSGQLELRIEFPAPSPLGLLAPSRF